MKPARIDPKITLTRTGLQISDELSYEEWQSMASRFGAAMSSAAFVIGDWLVYGEDHFRGQKRLPGFEDESIGNSRVSTEIYNEALRLTGLDRSTLVTYAYVSRRVPTSLRVATRGTHAMLEKTAAELGIPLVLDAELPALQAALSSVMRSLGHDDDF
jgi:hypothetical protein